MKRVLFATGALMAALVALLGLHLATAEGDTVFSGRRPAHPGISAGKLAACARTPNCVSSQAPAEDAAHHVAPLAFGGSRSDAMAALRAVLASLPRARVIREDSGYLHAEFRSKWMGFVDDVEFVHDAKAGVIHVRSASRLGRRDFGVNRARVESIRALLLKSPAPR